jgi:DNA-binding NtrC family response regulator
MGLSDWLSKWKKKFPQHSGTMSLRARMLATFIPVVIMTLLVTGYLTYQITTGFLRIPLGNEGRVHLASLVHEVEQYLERCRKDLLMIAQEPQNPANISRYLASMRKTGGIDARMLGYISIKDGEHVVFVARGDILEQIPAALFGDTRPSLFTFYDDIKNLQPGETWISKIKRIEYPLPIPDNPNFKVVTTAICFGTPLFSAEGRLQGYFILAVEALDLRCVFTDYHLRDSRIPPFPPEEIGARYSYFFDPDGWIVLDSGNTADPKDTLGTELARYGYNGILGSPENPAAFKPEAGFASFWGMVNEVKQGRYGVTKTANLEKQSPTFKEHFCAYGPVMFSPGNQRPPVIYGGIAFVDRSRLTEAAGQKQFSVISVVTLAAIVLLAIVIFSLAHYITRPLSELTRAVDRMELTGRMEYLEIPRAGYETNLLKNSINSLISRIQQQLEQIRVSERLREEADLRISAEMEKEQSPYSPHAAMVISGVVGTSERVEGLRADILKAARVDADVLILGETGTGKQLTAEAIHHHGVRSHGPFVSVNCGELDEHLLLDSLFGHVKGAFTEAKGDRKGAFLEASGGVLFLDEIQTASSSIQQALLRAISQRTFRPLGSDKDMAVDVRVITASNENLSERVSQGRFRQDLYFRMKVITIHTPPLREIREDIPLLVRHYFLEAKKISRKEKLKMSKGAIEKLRNYEWPGNVRELKNCLTRAVVMSEGPVIQSEDLLLEGGREPPAGPEEKMIPNPTAGAGERSGNKPALLPLNPRQRKAYPLIQEKGSITRIEYQWVNGGSVPSRTAIYDLQDMVRKGFLKKSGSGPATRYVVAGQEETERQPT